MTALPFPPEARILRGVQSALAELDASGRPDIAHTIAMAQLALGHLLRREDAADLSSLHADIAAAVSAGRSRLGFAPMPVGAAPTVGYDATQAAVAAALAALAATVSEAAREGVGGDDPLYREAESLEQRFYATAAPTAAPLTGPAPLTRAGFETYLLARFPGVYTRVAAFRKLVGGFQKETVLVDAERADGGVDEMVIRAEKHDRFVRFTASAIPDEYAIVRMLWDKGVRVAEPLWLEADEALLGRRFMVSRRAAGANTGSAYGDSGRFPDALVRSFTGALAAIHAVPIDHAVRATALGRWADHATLAENTRAEIAAWRHQIWLDRAPPSPCFTRLFDWLEANVPDEEARPCVLHNDYGPHNILVADDVVTAVLDWEVPRIGDPAEDLSFFLQCAGAAIDRDAALAAYEEQSGNRISAFRLAYFDVLSVAKVLVSTLSATTMYQSTEPALIDWLQMPLLMHGAYAPRTEAVIAAAEACR